MNDSFQGVSWDDITVTKEDADRVLTPIKQREVVERLVCAMGLAERAYRSHLDMPGKDLSRLFRRSDPIIVALTEAALKEIGEHCRVRKKSERNEEE